MIKVEFDFTEKFVKTSFATFLEVVFTKIKLVKSSYATLVSSWFHVEFVILKLPKKIYLISYRSNEIPIFHRSCTHWHPNPKRNMENVSIFRERTSSAYRPWNRISWSPRNLFPVRYVSLEGRGQTRPWTVLAMVGQIMCGSRRPYFYVNHLLWPSIVAKAHDLAF